jgi:hypothetical protein
MYVRFARYTSVAVPRVELHRLLVTFLRALEVAPDVAVPMSEPAARQAGRQAWVTSCASEDGRERVGGRGKEGVGGVRVWKTGVCERGEGTE